MLKKVKPRYRFYPVSRTALDGTVWWKVWDSKNNIESTLLCHGRYRTRRTAQANIDRYEREGWYNNAL